MNETVVAHLPLRDAIELASALCAVTARDNEVRTLLIKGLVANAHRLRGPYQPSDVDVMVEPSGFDKFVSALEQKGWERRFSRPVPGVLPEHSTTLVHDAWPCDIDVHSYFPGFFADPPTVFNELARTAVEMTFANVPVSAAGYAASIAISALHAGRHPQSPRHKAEYAELVDRAKKMSDTDRRDLDRLARVCRAETTLADILVIANLRVDPDLSARESARWDLFVATHEAGATSGWMFELMSQRTPRGAAHVFRRAILPRPSEVRTEVGRGVTGTTSLVSYYLRRLRRGLHAAPSACLALTRYQTLKNDSEIPTPPVHALRSEPNIVVGLATAGRPDIAAQLIQQLELSTTPFRGIISVPGTSDLPSNITPRWKTLTGTRGLAAQRNAILRQLDDDVDIVFFFDDDAVPRRDYIGNVVRVMGEDPSIWAVTGDVLADGASQDDEISFEEALAKIADSFRRIPEDHVGWVDDRHRKLYGCNFAIRRDYLKDQRFDERLPLYSWLEDYDYALRALRCGKLARVEGATIVHRGARSGGRTNHVRFGYSQVMNPVYFVSKGSFTLPIAAVQIFRPVAKNIALSMVPGQRRQVRRRRVRGNLLAAFDAVRGRLTPERILDLGDR